MANIQPKPIHHLEHVPSVNSEGEIITSNKKKIRLENSQDVKNQKTTQFVYENRGVINQLISLIHKRFYKAIKYESQNVPNIAPINQIVERQQVMPLHVKSENKEGRESIIGFLQTHENVDEVLTHYQVIAQNYTPLRMGQELQSQKKVRTGLTPETLMKVITVVVREKLPKLEISQTHIKFVYDTKTFIAKKEGPHLKLHSIGSVLGKGAFGIVYTAIALHSGVTLAYKAARLAIPRAKQDVMNEVAKLQKIHANGNVWGIQAKPHEVVNILQANQYGFLGEKYDQDYLDEIQNRFKTDPSTGKFSSAVPLEQSFYETHQLLFGLQHLHSQGYVHRDLKLENILTKAEEDGGRLVHIADFGAVSQMTEGEPFPEISSPAYTHLNDAYQIRDTLQSSNPNKQALLYKMGQQEDVFSMGCILYSALTGTYPFLKKTSGYPTGNCEPILNERAPLEIRSLIEKMLSPDADARPSAKEAFEIFDQWLQKEPYSQLHKMIHQKMDRDYRLKIPVQTQVFPQAQSNLGQKEDLHAGIHFIRQFGAKENIHVANTKEEALQILKNASDGSCVIWESSRRDGSIGLLIKESGKPPLLQNALRIFHDSNLRLIDEIKAQIKR